MIDFVSMVKKCDTSLFSIDIERLNSYKILFVTKSRHSCPEKRLTLKVNYRINHYLHTKILLLSVTNEIFHQVLPEIPKFLDFFFVNNHLIFMTWTADKTYLKEKP